MSVFQFIPRRLPLFAALAVTASLSVAAQELSPAAGSILPLPNKCTDLNKWEVKKTPSISGGSSASKAKVWGVFDVAFASKPEWLDELTVTYSVMLFKKDADKDKGEKNFHFFRTTVSYGDIPKDREHRAGVVLLPVALQRWGVPMGFAAQFTVDGEEVCPAYHVQAGLLDKRANDWWSNDNIVAGPLTEVHEGYLLDRAKSPFALVEPDSYLTSSAN